MGSFFIRKRLKKALNGIALSCGNCGNLLLCITQINKQGNFPPTLPFLYEFILINIHLSSDKDIQV